MLVALKYDTVHFPCVGQCDDAFLDVVAGLFGACGAGGGDGVGRGRRLGRTAASCERGAEGEGDGGKCGADGVSHCSFL